MKNITIDDMWLGKVSIDGCSGETLAREYLYKMCGKKLELYDRHGYSIMRLTYKDISVYRDYVSNVDAPEKDRIAEQIKTFRELDKEIEEKSRIREIIKDELENMEREKEENARKIVLAVPPPRKKWWVWK